MWFPLCLHTFCVLPFHYYYFDHIRKAYAEFIQNVSAGEVSLSRDVLVQAETFSAGAKSMSTRFLSSEQPQSSIACCVLLVVTVAAAALLCICIAAGSCGVKGPKPTAFPCPGNLRACCRTETSGNKEMLLVLTMGWALTHQGFFSVNE